MKRYREYKNSDLTWIDQIPQDWEIVRVKNEGSVNGRVGWKALKASEYVESGHFFLSTPNIKKVEIDFENVNYITSERYFESPEIMLRKGDVLLVKDGSTLGIVNVVRHLPSEGTVNSSIAVLRLKKFDPIYCYYLLLSNYIQNTIQLKKDGMGVPHLFQKDINNFPLLKPPFSEQSQIAIYLDLKTSAIDKKNKLLEKKAETYKELKMSLINQAITKGIDKSEDLKESGIDWVGQVPRHWQSDRGKSLFNEKSIKNRPNEPLLAASQKMGVVLKQLLEQRSMEALKDFENFKYVEKGDFVISLRSFEGGFEYAYYSGIISPAYTVFEVDIEVLDVHYFRYLFKSPRFIKYLQSRITGIRDGQSIKFKEVQMTTFPIPPKEEQVEIAKYLDKNIGTIDDILNNLSGQIQFLTELRRTLINDAVTGQIKVTV